MVKQQRLRGWRTTTTKLQRIHTNKTIRIGGGQPHKFLHGNARTRHPDISVRCIFVASQTIQNEIETYVAATRLEMSHCLNSLAVTTIRMPNSSACNGDCRRRSRSVFLQTFWNDRKTIFYFH